MPKTVVGSTFNDVLQNFLRKVNKSVKGEEKGSSRVIEGWVEISLAKRLEGNVESVFHCDTCV